MMTPPKDKPVLKDKEVSAEKDDLANDAAVAAQDTEIKPQSESEGNVRDNDIEDLNTDPTGTGLNGEQGDEFL